MKHQIWKALSLIVILTLALTACGRSAAPAATPVPVVGGVPVTDASKKTAPGMPTTLDQLRAHANLIMQTEMRVSNDIAAKWMVIDQKKTAILEKNMVAKSCIKDAGEVIVDAAGTRYEKKDAQGNPTGEFDDDAFINALVVDESYPGDIQTCLDIRAELSRDVIAMREEVGHIMVEIKDWQTELDLLYGDDILKDVATNVWNDALTWAAEQLGVEKIPYLGDYNVPTYKLHATTYTKALCDREAAKGMCTWDDIYGEGELTSMAAYKHLFRMLLSEDGVASWETRREKALDLN